MGKFDKVWEFYDVIEKFLGLKIHQPFPILFGGVSAAWIEKMELCLEDNGISDQYWFS